MSDLLSIGASGLRAYQTALGTTSDNIANASTPGYVRRTTNLAEVGGNVSGAGLGVAVLNIGRADVSAQSETLRAADSDLSRTQTTIGMLDQLDNALSGADLGARLTDFFNAADQVAADPSASAPRSVMLENANSVAQAFSTTGAAIDRIDADITAQGQNAADQLTSYSAALAKINNALARSQDGSSGKGTLLDQRDQILSSMSQLTDISTSFDSFGRATVKGGSSSGPVLVQGSQSSTVNFARNDEGAIAFSVSSNNATEVLSPAGGAMAGLAEGAQRVADARDQLDTMAAGFVDGVNQVQANGRDLNGNAGAPIFASDPADPSKVTMAMTDWRGVAAAGVGGGPRDNSNLTELSSLRTSAGFETGIATLTSANGAALAARQTVADAQTTIRDQAQASLDTGGAVDLDQEAVNLLRYQQAYQASSRVIQVARETMQSLFQIG